MHVLVVLLGLAGPGVLVTTLVGVSGVGLDPESRADIVDELLLGQGPEANGCPIELKLMGSFPDRGGC
jgi:hypothetical protein